MKVRMTTPEDIGQVREVDNDEARALLDAGDAEPVVEREVEQAEQRPEGVAAERRTSLEPGPTDATLPDPAEGVIPPVAQDPPPAPEPVVPPAQEDADAVGRDDDGDGEPDEAPESVSEPVESGDDSEDE